MTQETLLKQEENTQIKKDNLDPVQIRKDSRDHAKFSADTLAKESNLTILAKTFSGLFGSIILFSAISKIGDNIKNKKKNFWIFYNTVLEFTAAGVLIGYTLNFTLVGLIAGLAIGIIVLVVEIKIINNKTVS